jgi:hypothetical protein
MADFQQKPNTGTAFNNDKKGNDKAPDLRGTLNVEGKEYNIALWNKQGKKGPFYSIAISEPRVTQQQVKDNDPQDLPF